MYSALDLPSGWIVKYFADPVVFDVALFGQPIRSNRDCNEKCADQSVSEK